MKRTSMRTKRARQPRLPNPKAQQMKAPRQPKSTAPAEPRQTVQFRASEHDLAVIKSGVAAEYKATGVKWTVSDFTRRAITMYPEHARLMGEANARIAELTAERDALRARLARLEGGGGGGGGGMLRFDTSGRGNNGMITVAAVGDVDQATAEEAAEFDLQTGSQLTCDAGRHALMFEGPCEDCAAEQVPDNDGASA